MKFALFLCLAFAIAVESFGGAGETYNLEDVDEPDVDITTECKRDEDCQDNECCFKTYSHCIPKKEEGESCSPVSLTCFDRCQDGLECKQVNAGPYLCSRPMAPPPEPEGSGSGEVESLAD